MGYDPWSPNTPTCVVEGSLLHALRCVEAYFVDCSNKTTTAPKYVEIKVGDRELHRVLAKWVKKGTLETVTIMMSQITERLHRLTSKLSCALVLCQLDEDFFEDARLTGQRACDIVYATSRQFSSKLCLQIWSK